MFRKHKQSYFIYIIKGVLEDNDLKFMEKYKNGEIPMMYPKPGNYSLNFTITDPVKANLFILDFLCPSKKENEDIGIKVTSLNLYTAISNSLIKERLENLLKEMELEEERLK